MTKSNFLSTIELNQKQIKPVSTVCVSGGIDSMALLHLMAHSPKTQILHIIHVNHGISPNALMWENFVQQEIEKLKQNPLLKHKKFFFKSYQLNLREKGEALTELNCREKRYEKIYEYCVENNLHDVYTAHHKNDFLENYFISIFKNRIYSLLMKNEVEQNVKGKMIKFYKPLLSYTKKDLEKVLTDNHLEHIHDESNEVDDNVRNVLRNQLFKGLENIKGHLQYMSSMESFFNHVNFSFSFYQKIIKEKILPLGSYKIYTYDNNYLKKGNEENYHLHTVDNTKEIFCLEVSKLMPYLSQNTLNNYFFKRMIEELKEENNANELNCYTTDEKFLIETINLFFYSKTGYYLTGKNKKHLKTVLQSGILNGKETVLLNDKEVYFSFQFNRDQIENEEDIELSQSDKMEALKKCIFSFELKIKK